MSRILSSFLALLCLGCVSSMALIAQPASTAPLRVAIVGLNHGHVSGFLKGGALVPAGGALHRPDIQIVGIVEPDRKLFDAYVQRLHLSPDLYFANIKDMAAKVHPDAALVFTSTFGHTQAVEECTKFGMHVMMEKPLAVSYKDALAMQSAAKRANVTCWWMTKPRGMPATKPLMICCNRALSAKSAKSLCATAIAAPN